MRTIKFRGKRIDNGEWVFGFLFRTTVDGMPCNCILNGDSLFDDTSLPEYISMYFTLNKDLFVVVLDTVGQFTGLYDKNGEEIYEGDVVKFANPKYGDELFRIGYEDSHIGAFCLCEAGEEDTSRFVAIFGRFDYEPFYCEVIGNIHDNPELLEGGEK